MRLQTIVVRVARVSSLTPSPGMPLQGLIPGQVDIANVRSYLDSLGKQLTPEAQQLLESMESKQMSQSRSVADRFRSVSLGGGSLPEHLGAMNLSGSETSILSQAMTRAKQLEEEEKAERMARNFPGSPEGDEDFINMLAGLMVEKSPESAENSATLSVENGAPDTPESPTLAKHRWETYLQSRVRASRNMVRKTRPVSLGSAIPVATQATMNPRAQSFCLEDKRSVERVMAEQVPAPLEKASSHSSDPGSKTRCAECGCPGCLSVYNSITTNIYAAEKRIMGRVEAKLQAMLEHMDSRFDTLFNSLLLRQEQPFTRSAHGSNNSFPGTRRLSQRNGHKPGDTSV